MKNGGEMIMICVICIEFFVNLNFNLWCFFVVNLILILLLCLYLFIIILFMLYVLYGIYFVLDFYVGLKLKLYK